MNYEQILFSRSKSVDYRWMLVSKLVTNSDENFIEKRIWTEGRKLLGKHGTLNPLYYLHFDQSSALLRMRRTNYEDDAGQMYTEKKAQNRLIDALEGIVVPIQQKWILRLYIACILLQQQQIMDVWETSIGSFASADAKIRYQSPSYEIKSDNLFVCQIPQMKLPTSTTHQHIIPFSPNGYKQLLSLLYPTEKQDTLSLYSFAFGVGATAKDKYQNFSIIGVTEKSQDSEWILPPDDSDGAYDPQTLPSSTPESPQFEDIVDSLRKKKGVPPRGKSPLEEGSQRRFWKRSNKK